MYDEVYEAMVGSGVAIKLDEEVHVDELGCIVSDEMGLVGRQSTWLLDQTTFCMLMKWGIIHHKKRMGT
jgi:hypothetical protein